MDLEPQEATGAIRLGEPIVQRRYLCQANAQEFKRCITHAPQEDQGPDTRCG